MSNRCPNCDRPMVLIAGTYRCPEWCCVTCVYDPGTYHVTGLYDRMQQQYPDRQINLMARAQEWRPPKWRGI